MSKVILFAPPRNSQGGVSNFIDSLEKYGKKIFFRKINPTSAYYMFLTFLSLLKSRPEIVVLNPSLQKRSLVRDYVLSILCRFLNIEYELIWHGWKNELIGIFPYSLLLKSIFKNARCNWVLNSAIKYELRRISDCNINMFRTKSDFSNQKKSLNPKSLLFSSRLVKEKGCLEALTILKNLPSDFHINVCGDGPELENLKMFVKINNLEKRVVFNGHLDPDEYQAILKKSDILLFPSTHPEGMPNVILEAIDCGLIIFSTDFAANLDLFSENKNQLYVVKIENYVNQVTDILINNFPIKNSLSPKSKYGIDKVWEKFYNQFHE